MPISADQSAVLEMLLTGGQTLRGSRRPLRPRRGRNARARPRGARGARRRRSGPERRPDRLPPGPGRPDRPRRRRPAPAPGRRRSRARRQDRRPSSTTLFPAAELPKLPQAPAGSRFGGRAAPPRRRSPRASPGPSTDRAVELHAKQTRMFAGTGRRRDHPDRRRARDRRGLLGRRRAVRPPPAETTKRPRRTTARSRRSLDADSRRRGDQPSSPRAARRRQGGRRCDRRHHGRRVSPTSTSCSRTCPSRRRIRPTSSGSCSTRTTATRWPPQIARERQVFEDRFAIPARSRRPISQFARAIEISLSNPEDSPQALPRRPRRRTRPDRAPRRDRPARRRSAAGRRGAAGRRRPAGAGRGRRRKRRLSHQLAGVHDPGRVEPLLERAQALRFPPRPPRPRM